MASEHTIEFTDGNFEAEVINSAVPVLVDYWAEWCMPCKMLAPTIDEIATEYDGKVKIGKMDTDSNREYSMKYGISAIPTLILFKDGEPIKKFVGLQQKAELMAAIDEAVSA
ncbi:MAG: thioredoxin [Phycisphaerae bacterium]|nr:thioredoxin [Phycisphaerae bacterium]